MRYLYFYQSNDEVPLSKTYEVKKQRVEVLSVFNSYKEVFMKDEIWQ